MAPADPSISDDAHMAPAISDDPRMASGDHDEDHFRSRSRKKEWKCNTRKRNRERGESYTCMEIEREPRVMKHRCCCKSKDTMCHAINEEESKMVHLHLVLILGGKEELHSWPCRQDTKEKSNNDRKFKSLIFLRLQFRE